MSICIIIGEFTCRAIEWRLNFANRLIIFGDNREGQKRPPPRPNGARNSGYPNRVRDNFVTWPDLNLFLTARCLSWIVLQAYQIWSSSVKRVTHYREKNEEGDYHLDASCHSFRVDLVNIVFLRIVGFFGRWSLSSYIKVVSFDQGNNLWGTCLIF